MIERQDSPPIDGDTCVYFDFVEQAQGCFSFRSGFSTRF